MEVNTLLETNRWNLLLTELLLPIHTPEISSLKYRHTAIPLTRCQSGHISSLVCHFIFHAPPYVQLTLHCQPRSAPVSVRVLQEVRLQNKRLPLSVFGTPIFIVGIEGSAWSLQYSKNKASFSQVFFITGTRAKGRKINTVFTVLQQADLWFSAI